MGSQPIDSDTNSEAQRKYPPFSFKTVGDKERMEKVPAVTRENTGAERNPMGKSNKAD